MKKHRIMSAKKLAKTNRAIPGGINKNTSHKIKSLRGMKETPQPFLEKNISKLGKNLLTEKNSEQKFILLKKIEERRDFDALPAVVKEIMSSRNSLVFRRHCVALLGRLKVPKAHRVIRNLVLSSPEQVIRFGCIEALIEYRKQSDVPLLIEVMKKDSNLYNKGAAVYAIKTFGTEKQIKRALKLAQNLGERVFLEKKFREVIK